MELKAGKQSDVVAIGSYRHMKVNLDQGSIKLFLKGDNGIKICFFSSIRENYSLDVSDYDTVVFEAFDDCVYSCDLS